MVKTKIEFEVDVPEGWEFVEVRRPKKGEHYLSGYAVHGREAKVYQTDYDFTSGMYPIVRKTPVWKQLTPEKALAFMLARTPVTMRHISWDTGKTVTQTIEQIYYDTPMCNKLSTKLECQCHIENVRYLVEGDDA